MLGSFEGFPLFLVLCLGPVGKIKTPRSALVKFWFGCFWGYRCVATGLCGCEWYFWRLENEAPKHGTKKSFHQSEAIKNLIKIWHVWPTSSSCVGTSQLLLLLKFWRLLDTWKMSAKNTFAGFPFWKGSAPNQGIFIHITSVVVFFWHLSTMAPVQQSPSANSPVALWTGLKCGAFIEGNRP